MLASSLQMITRLREFWGSSQTLCLHDVFTGPCASTPETCMGNRKRKALDLFSVIMNFLGHRLDRHSLTPGESASLESLKQMQTTPMPGPALPALVACQLTHHCGRAGS